MTIGANALTAVWALRPQAIKLGATIATGKNADNFHPRHEGVDDAGIFSLFDDKFCAAGGAFCIGRLHGRITFGALPWEKGVAVGALICTRCQLKAAKRAIEIKLNVAMWANFSILVYNFVAMGAKGCLTGWAKAIFHEERRVTSGAIACEHLLFCITF